MDHRGRTLVSRTMLVGALWLLIGSNEPDAAARARSDAPGTPSPASRRSLHFTAPADSPATVATGPEYRSSGPVHAYLFQLLDKHRILTAIRGYADSIGSAILAPHAPGTPETVWIEPGVGADSVTIYVMSIDSSGNVSAPSNGCVIHCGARKGPIAAVATGRSASSATFDGSIERPLQRSRAGR